MEAWVYFALQFWAGTLKMLISLVPNSIALLKTHLTLNLQMPLEDCGTLEAAVLGSAVTCTGWCTAPCNIQPFLSPYSVDNVVTQTCKMASKDTPYLLTGQQGTQAWKIFLFNCRGQLSLSLAASMGNTSPVPPAHLSLVVIPEEPLTLLCARALQVL